MEWKRRTCLCTEAIRGKEHYDIDNVDAFRDELLKQPHIRLVPLKALCAAKCVVKHRLPYFLTRSNVVLRVSIDNVRFKDRGKTHKEYETRTTHLQDKPLQKKTSFC